MRISKIMDIHMLRMRKNGEEAQNKWTLLFLILALFKWGTIRQCDLQVTISLFTGNAVGLASASLFL